MKHSIPKTIPASTATTLFTVPAGYIAEVYMVFISNTSGSTGSCSFKWYWNGSSVKVLNSKSLSNGDYIQFSNGSIIMQAGDRLEFTCSQPMDVIASFDLIQAPPMYVFTH
jgi:hypothetical protein